MKTQRVLRDDRWHLRGPNGRPVCKWCRAEVPGRRRSYCSDACAHEWQIRAHPAYLREQVFKRDKGVCADCGLDTEALRKTRPPKPHWKLADEERRMQMERWQNWEGEMNRRGFFLHRSFWDADHIVPVVKGGGGCTLDNIRTLCVPCHRKATAKLSAQRAAERKTAKANNLKALPLFKGITP